MILQVIPAIDIIDGKCVRLTTGDYNQKMIYNEHPLEVAKQFEGAGIRRLHLVDLDGAKVGHVKNWKVLDQIASRTGLVIDFGGGIQTEDAVKVVFESGAAMAAIGSIAVRNEPELVRWIQKFGAAKFLLGADVRSERIAIQGWQEDTSVWIYDLVEKFLGHGLEQVFCTDISKDGKLEGPSTDLYKEIRARFPKLLLIASGGIRSMDDLVSLQEIGCTGAIVGKAIYENRIQLADLLAFA